MKYSIRKNFFYSSIVTTFISFLLILICFNYISSRYIERETSEELNEAAESFQARTKIDFMQEVGDIIAMDSDIIQSIPDVDISSEIAPNINFANNILDDTLNKIPDVEYIVLNNKNEVISPISIAVSEDVRLEFAEININIEDDYYKEKEIYALKEAAKETSFVTPRRMNLNNSSYYLLEVNLREDARALFYKNTQSLDDLVADVNLALFLILLLSSILTIVLNMSFTNKIVKSIRKLCKFANAIGQGNLEEQQLNLREKEFIILEQDMNKMAKKLAQYDVEQKTFFQNISHELRTPLMSIQGYTEGILSRVFENEKVDYAANIILNESTRLSEMVNNLLYVSRMENHECIEKKDTINLIDSLELAIEGVAGIATNINIEFEKDNDSFSVYGNKDELTRAFINVLTNCIRYAKTEIMIQCSSNDRTIRICDDGPGIKEKDLQHIFKRLYKGDGGCTGIGLAITETILKNHNGSIEAFNDHGAVFLVKLP